MCEVVREKCNLTNKKCLISYRKLEDHLDDLEVIIFDEVNFKPWDEIKYKKRLYRILILTFLIYFNQNDGISFKSKLSVIDKMITHISKDDYDLKIKVKDLNLTFLDTSNYRSSKFFDSKQFSRK